MSHVVPFLFMVLLAGVSRTKASQQMMMHITMGFLKMLKQCQEELDLPDHLVADLYNYWKEEYELLNRDTGCAILCMSRKLEMVDADGKLHHVNAQEFALKHGATDEMASKLVALLHKCEKLYEAIEDDCSRILEIAKCFRTDVRQLDWAPTMDFIISEVLTQK